MDILMAGLRMASLAPRVLTTVVWGQGGCTGGTSWRLTTGAASMQGSGSLVLMLRLCQLSGSFKWGPLRGLIWGMIYGRKVSSGEGG